MKIFIGLLLTAVLSPAVLAKDIEAQLSKLNADINTFSKCYFLAYRSSKSEVEIANDRMLFLSALEKATRKQMLLANKVDPEYQRALDKLNNKDVALGFFMAEGIYFRGKLPDQYLSGNSKLTWENSGCQTILSFMKQ